MIAECTPQDYVTKSNEGYRWWLIR